MGEPAELKSNATGIPLSGSRYRKGMIGLRKVKEGFGTQPLGTSLTTVPASP